MAILWKRKRARYFEEKSQQAIEPGKLKVVDAVTDEGAKQGLTPSKLNPLRPESRREGRSVRETLRRVRTNQQPL